MFVPKYWCSRTYIYKGRLVETSSTCIAFRSGHTAIVSAIRSPATANNSHPRHSAIQCEAKPSAPCAVCIDRAYSATMLRNYRLPTPSRIQRVGNAHTGETDNKLTETSCMGSSISAASSSPSSSSMNSRSSGNVNATRQTLTQFGAQPGQANVHTQVEKFLILLKVRGRRKNATATTGPF